jgi:uncharacterized protein (DUF1684 family)
VCCVARAWVTRGSPWRRSLRRSRCTGSRVTAAACGCPFRTASSGAQSYGGGRYLYDTIKGADLGIAGSEILLDFNFAYNPSCAYDDRWSCPLSPPENRLPFAVNAGERIPF